MRRSSAIGWALAALALVAVAVVVALRDRAADAPPPERLGERVLANFPASEVARITLRHGDEQVAMARREGGWEVEERGYPADAERIRDLLLKMRELKIADATPVAPAQLARLELAEPGASGGGTLVAFADASGKGLGELIVGKESLRGGGGSEPGVPVGRYLLSRADPGTAIVVADTLPDLGAKPVLWLSKAFVRIEGARSIAVSDAAGKGLWAIERDTEKGPWRFADSQPDAPDEAKANEAARAFEAVGFSDVVGPAATAAAKLEGAMRVRVGTVDGFTYDVRIGAPATPEQRYFAVSVSADYPRERKTDALEKPEDREQRDKDFAERLKGLDQRLAQDREFENWVYLVPSRMVERLLQPRERLLPDRQKTEGKGGGNP